MLREHLEVDRAAHAREMAAQSQKHVSQIKLLVDEMAQLKGELRSFLMQEKEKARADEATFRDKLLKDIGALTMCMVADCL